VHIQYTDVYCDRFYCETLGSVILTDGGQEHCCVLLALYTLFFLVNDNCYKVVICMQMCINY